MYSAIAKNIHCDNVVDIYLSIYHIFVVKAVKVSRVDPTETRDLQFNCFKNVT
jgi:hypothetical protein